MSFVEQMRKHEATKNSIIIAVNVCTPEATEQIILAGADIVKIGIGPGSCLLYTSPSPRDKRQSRMPSSA